jgi:hypothetical protein
MLNERVGDESHPDVRLFESEGSAEGCAAGECAPTQPAPTASTATSESPEAQWAAGVDAVRAHSPRHGKSLSFARLVALEGQRIDISFPKEAAFHRATIMGPNRALVESLLAGHFGHSISLVEVAVDAASPVFKSIAETEEAVRLNREEAIERKVRSHVAVQAVLSHLGGAIEHIQVLEVPTSAGAPLPPSNDEES